MEKQGRVVITLCAAVALQGCLVEVTHYKGSGAVVPEAKRSIHAGDTATLNFSDLKATVQIQDLRRSWTQFGFILPVVPIPGGRKPPSPLRVWIDLESNDDSFSFDPGRVTLHTSTHQVLAPVGYWGPGVGSWRAGFGNLGSLACGVPSSSNAVPTSNRYRHRVYGKFHYAECFNCRRKSASAVKSPETTIPLNGPSCFVLLFDAPPSPDEEFVVSLAGLDRHGAPLPAQECDFKEASAWDGLFFPGALP